MQTTYLKTWDGTYEYWACKGWGDTNTHDFQKIKLQKSKKQFDPQTGKKL